VKSDVHKVIDFKMALKVPVKVGNITNLSDARYCAGMGVDLLGFTVVPGKEGYVEPRQFQEMRGWFSGPQVVAEAYGADDLNDIINQYQPDLIELSVEDMLVLNPIAIKLVVAISAEGLERHRQIIDQYKPDIAYLLVPETQSIDELRKLASEFQVLVDNAGDNISELIEIPRVGVALKGSAETRPGYKNYDELARVLAFLEEE
jgi:phosphoribosylanthranilate isomerase